MAGIGTGTGDGSDTGGLPSHNEGTIAQSIEMRLSNEFGGAVLFTGDGDVLDDDTGLKYEDYFTTDGYMTEKMRVAMDGARAIVQLGLQVMRDARAGLIQSMPGIADAGPQACAANRHSCNCRWEQFWQCNNNTCEWRWRWVCDCCANTPGEWA